MTDSSKDFLRVAVCQIDTTVGDLDGNVSLALAALAEAESSGADLAVMPEMTITGYPPEDLLLKPGFVADSRSALEKFAAATDRCAAMIGFADGARSQQADHRWVPGTDGTVRYSNGVWNAVAVCAGGRVIGTYHKRHLPNYDVFDELRHFRPGDGSLSLFSIAGFPVGVTLCEDAWIPDGPVSQLARGGARLVVNINGSPFREGKAEVRESVIRRRVGEAGVPIVYANLVGGQDELVFDGGSFVVGADGEIMARCSQFNESVDIIDVDLPDPSSTLDSYPVVVVTPARQSHPERVEPPMEPLLGVNEERWRALTLATRSYVTKSGFSDVCVGLSGGIDSSLVAAVAVHALGPDHVHGVLMPSRYSSDHSISDAEALATNLHIDIRTIAIEPAHGAFTSMLEPNLSDRRIEVGDLTDQNLQSRIRGVLLMALANEHRWLVLTTGNKSESAVGYSTLYGDTAGAYAVIKDVWKLTVYELCRWRNEVVDRELIPESVLRKAPSAELRPDQRDDQSLPPYEILDPILRAYVEGDHTVAEVTAMNLADPDTVSRVCRLVDLAEYKRRQSPPGARLTGKSFGRDRRLPIVNDYRG